VSRKIGNLDDFLHLLNGVRKKTDYDYMALCPAHVDTNPSLSVTKKDGKILVYCFAGCQLEEIVKSLNLEEKDLFLDHTIADKQEQPMPGEKSGYTVTPQANQIQNGVTSPVLSTVTGVTLEALAQKKHLNVDYLKSIGLTDYNRKGQPVIQIPYCDENGETIAVRFRLTLDASSGKQRFAWRKDDQVMLYGLERLETIKQQGWLLLVEGESDCWTLWYHSLPALGIPGKGVWQSEWAKHMNGLKVYLWQEPDAEDLTFRLLKDIPNLEVIKAPDGIKDISEAHIQGKDIPSFLDGLKKTVKSGQEIRAESVKKQASELYNRAKEVIECDDPLKVVENEIRRLGYGGDIKPALISYLAATSRLLEMRNGSIPVHVLLAGPSSSGKSYTLSIIKRLLPVDVYHEIDAGSPHAIIYDEAALKHKALVFGEADSVPSGEDSPVASALRNLLQEHYLHYCVTERDPVSQRFKVREINKPGPTVLMTTATKKLPYQLSTRLFTIEMSDSAEQIRAALEAQACLETEDGVSPSDSLIAMQGYFQLQVPIKVNLPFAMALAHAIGKRNPSSRMNRDFGRIVSLTKVVAILRSHHRTDKLGNITATTEDYGTVRELINDLYIDNTGASDEICHLIEAVTKLKRQLQDQPVSGTKVAQYLGIHKMTVSRLTRKAIEEGWLVNQELRKGHPASYAVGEPLPPREGLPTVEEVSGNEMSGNSVTDGNKVVDTASEFENEGCNTVTPVPAKNMSDLDEEAEAVEDEF
jgi:biotin operon repressor